MASGDVVGMVLRSMAPATARADPSVRAGGSSPAEHWPVIRYDGFTPENWDFLCALEGYGNTGIRVELPWFRRASGVGTTVRWQAAIRAVPDDAEVVTAAHAYIAQGVTSVEANVLGEVKYPFVTLTHGTQMDSLANKERFILRVTRDPTHVDDNMENDASLIWPAIVIREP